MKPLVLCILDGVGLARRSKNNAVALAKMPFLDGLMRKYPHAELSASGESVGLPKNTMGNSEVGHITLGTGRTVNQFLRRFQLEKLVRNRPLGKFIRDVRASGGLVHMVGLCSDGRVHSDLVDALVVAKILQKRGLGIVWHFIADGRDVSPKSAISYVRQIRRALGRDVMFGSISGRYYAMDRDNNWDRSQLAFHAIMGDVRADNRHAIEEIIKKSYRNGIIDEFIKPVRFDAPTVERRDGVLFFNYRADRARQFLKLLVMARHRKILCFSQYGDGLDKNCPALLPDIPIRDTLGDILAKNKLSQLRLAETEKYNHVTYFFDAERMIDYPFEKKILVPSPKVKTFDLAPDMALPEITREFMRSAAKFDVVIMNYANGDMVGHTGNMNATVKAMEALDWALAKIVPHTLGLGGSVLITADHGNAERMADWRGQKWTAHTTNKVPFVLVSNEKIKLGHVRYAGLANITPTMLKLLGIKPPRGMAAPLV